MHLYWHGLTSVRIESSLGDTSCSLLTDPYGSESGLRFPRTLEPNVLVLSHQKHELFATDALKNQPFLIADPGEYEVQGVFVFGTTLQEEGSKHPFSLIYRFEIEGLSVGFLGGINKVPSEEVLGRLENIDILLLPVGGGDYLDAKKAAEVVHTLEPRIVVPLAFAVEGMTTSLDSVDAFCKEVGGKRQDGNKLKISRKDLPAEELVVQVLERA
ncbi:MBL fold metallo-hydrolase [Patescibacteria group bacterium]|nr:MBL fold metallo-hydrolase [Patescibacteria group bacterium]